MTEITQLWHISEREGIKSIKLLGNNVYVSLSQDIEAGYVWMDSKED